MGHGLRRRETSGAHDGAYARSIRIDPSLTGPLQPGTTGSVAIRAAFGMASPRLAAAARSRRLRRKAIVDEDGPRPADLRDGPTIIAPNGKRTGV